MVRPNPVPLLPSGDPWAEPYRRLFGAALCDDLHLPGALATLWRLARDAAPRHKRLALALEFDGVLGLGLASRLAPGAAAAQGQLSAWQAARGVRAYRVADEILAGLRERWLASPARRT